jgi:hypothetical protein
MKWTKRNIPEYDSNRVTVEYIGEVFEVFDKIIAGHHQIINIDGRAVDALTVYEDNETSSPEYQWDNWVASLED